MRKATEEQTGTPLSEPDVAATLAEQYVWDLRYIDAPVLRDRDTGGDPDLDGRGHRAARPATHRPYNRPQRGYNAACGRGGGGPIG